MQDAKNLTAHGRHQEGHIVLVGKMHESIYY